MPWFPGLDFMLLSGSQCCTQNQEASMCTDDSIKEQSCALFNTSAEWLELSWFRFDNFISCIQRLLQLQWLRLHDWS